MDKNTITGLVLIGEMPAEETADFECVFCSEVHAGFAAKTISSKVFSHGGFDLCGFEKNECVQEKRRAGMPVESSLAAHPLS